MVFDTQQSWFELFRSTETFVDDTLAAHYDLTSVSVPQWVDVASSGRQGLLSHGSFLSAASNPADTSPTKRGRLIRERLMCSPVPPPPPDVPVDEPPDPSLGNCKEDQYAAHSSDPSCASCHSLMDPIGFGLENFDRSGRYRGHDEGKPECVIKGEGNLLGAGNFIGPAELSDLLLEQDAFDDCAVRQLFEYVMGRPLDAQDDRYIGDLAMRFEDSDHHFDELLIELTAHDAFGYRLDPNKENN